MIDLIPEYMKESLREYVQRGVPLGGFLSAVVSDEFLEAFKRADDGNTAIMHQYACYVYNEMPMGSHGSREIYKSWIDEGGLEGMEKEVAT